MSVRITQLTRGDDGTYSESGDMAADMLAGGQMPETAEDAYSDWLRDVGYRRAEGFFAGWGLVLRHEETGELISCVTV